MASKDKDTLPKSQTTTLATEENVVPQPSQRGLASISTSAITEAGKSTDVIQKAQVSPDAAKMKGEIIPSKRLPLCQQCALVSTLWRSGSKLK